MAIEDKIKVLDQLDLLIRAELKYKERNPALAEIMAEAQTGLAKHVMGIRQPGSETNAQTRLVLSSAAKKNDMFEEIFLKVLATRPYASKLNAMSKEEITRALKDATDEELQGLLEIVRNDLEDYYADIEYAKEHTEFPSPGVSRRLSVDLPKLKEIRDIIKDILGVL